jgi:hypothetical protein
MAEVDNPRSATTLLFEDAASRQDSKVEGAFEEATESTILLARRREVVKTARSATSSTMVPPARRTTSAPRCASCSFGPAAPIRDRRPKPAAGSVGNQIGASVP